MEYGLTLLVLAALGIGWFCFHASEARRELALEKQARRLGLNWRFGLPRGLREHLPRFRAIEKAQESGGEFQAGINTVGGDLRGRKVVFFDYEWVTVRYRRSRWPLFGDLSNEYESRFTHTRSAVAAELGCSLQPVLIRPERLVDKALALVGYEDIDFDAFPEFSSRFYVNSPSRDAARRLITPAFAKFCLDHVDCTVDVVGRWALVHRNGKLSPSRAGAMIALASQLAELLTREQSR
jgi:hypothetical protein